MKHLSSFLERTTALIAVSLISLFGCCGFGVSLNHNSKSKIEDTYRSPNDSIVFDIIEVLQEETGLSEKRREEIERRINTFPDRIIRRDTSTYFLQTVLGIAYNEFVTEDFEQAKMIAEKFKSSIEEPGLMDNISRYSVIKYTPSALKTKEKHRDDTFPSSYDILNKSITEFEYSRGKVEFMADIFEGLPMNLELQTYKILLSVYKDLGGGPSSLNELLVPGFYHHCKVSEREDILAEVYSLWGINENNFSYDDTHHYYYYVVTPTSKLDFSGFNKKNLREMALSMYDSDGNISFIDSLILIGEQDSIGRYIENYQFLKNQRGEYRDLIRFSEKYEDFIPQNWKHRFYDYWAIAFSALGENEQALEKYTLSIKNRVDENVFSGAVLNYGLTLAEMGRYNEALKIYQTQRDKAQTIPNLIFYWEGLGYIYSLFNKDKALECFIQVDKLVEETPYTELKVGDNYLTRHFAREARLLDHDLFQWREALTQARFYSGEDSYFNLYGTIHNAIYHSEMGRYRNFLFDFEGAATDFEAAQRKIEKLDSADYRVKWWNDSWQALHRFGEEYGKDEKTILTYISSDKISSLHKLWLILNLILEIATDTVTYNDLFSNGYVIDNLQSNLSEAMMALSSDESKFLIVPVLKMQELLMPIESLQENPEELARLNLLRKGMIQTSKVAIEKELMTGNKKADYEELKELRKRLNHAYIYEDSLRVRKLLLQISSKERELYYSMRDSLSMGNVIFSNPQSICSNLRENDLAIDFIEYLKNDTIITGAFLYFPSGDIQYLDLLVDGIRNKEEKLWERLVPFMKDKKEIYFSPDGSLINKGIEYYRDENGIPLFQNHKLHRVSHLRNIGRKNESINGEIAVIGVSDHNSPIGEAGQLYRGDWTDLPDVEYEVKLIDTTLYNYPHQLLFNDDAIEEKVKAMDGKDISVIHFSTHGVYRSLDSLNYAASNNNHFDHNIALRTLKSDRQQISGIVLRKGNLTWQIPHLLDDEDDILTAEEIEVMNFPNLQLTVLSACDSGLGEIDGDGIQGLQKAFRIAGSKNIICSLNKVDDYWSAQFMGQLYENLVKGQTIYDSFRNAQLNIKLAAPDNPVAWSSYILIE